LVRRFALACDCRLPGGPTGREKFWSPDLIPRSVFGAIQRQIQRDPARTGEGIAEDRQTDRDPYTEDLELQDGQVSEGKGQHDDSESHKQREEQVYRVSAGKIAFFPLERDAARWTVGLQGQWTLVNVLAATIWTSTGERSAKQDKEPTPSWRKRPLRRLGLFEPSPLTAIEAAFPLRRGSHRVIQSDSYSYCHRPRVVMTGFAR
jgi:hypothetical protein